ncbi:MAG: hypothetical protein ACKVTZ_24145 [Bacteroidia bacterium]
MQKLDILLHKRKGKAMGYIAAAVGSALITFAAIPLVQENATWWKWLLLILPAIGTLMFIYGLWQYFAYKEVRLIVESDGEQIKFYNLSDSGKVFNEYDDIKLADMQRFYIKKETTRFLTVNYSFEFEPKSALGAILKEEVDPYPSLFESSEEDMKQVLLFVKEVAPEMELGYENIWQKLTK